MLRIAALLMSLAAAPALAHQPVLISGQDYPAGAPYEIEEPEISKAIFAELPGRPHYYRIDSPAPFRFYAGITVPKIDGCPLAATFSLDVLDADFRPILTADGETFDWWPWYEEYGKKWYWVGPEIGADFKADREFEAGTYYIRVYNEKNSGQYVLAVGDIESFPIGVIARTIFTMPVINREFWDEATCAAAQQ